MEQKNLYDVVILGSGPAGLQAAIHAARKKVSVLLLGKSHKSALWHAHVENFCCIFNMEGEQMLTAALEQVRRFGAELLEEDVLELQPDGNFFRIRPEGGGEIVGKTLIIATGATRKRLGVPGEKELLGKGVSYCVECDAGFFKGQDVAVVGSESAAASGAVTMARYASTVHLVCDRLQVAEKLRKDLETGGVKIHADVKVKEIAGSERVEALILKNGTRIPVGGVFIELGAKGALELATVLGIHLDEDMKYIETNKKQETNIMGVYAAGDICGPPWQMAKAVGEGCVAGIEAASFVRKMY